MCVWWTMEKKKNWLCRCRNLIINAVDWKIEIHEPALRSRTSYRISHLKAHQYIIISAWKTFETTGSAVTEFRFRLEQHCLILQSDLRYLSLGFKGPDLKQEITTYLPNFESMWLDLTFSFFLYLFANAVQDSMLSSCCWIRQPNSYTHGHLHGRINLCSSHIIAFCHAAFASYSGMWSALCHHQVLPDVERGPLAYLAPALRFSFLHSCVQVLEEMGRVWLSLLFAKNLFV